MEIKDRFHVAWRVAGKTRYRAPDFAPFISGNVERSRTLAACSGVTGCLKVLSSSFFPQPETQISANAKQYRTRTVLHFINGRILTK